MQITHEEARRLIQFKADNGLNSTNQTRLDSHLQVCAECRFYSDTIRNTESVLRQTLQNRLDIRPLPLKMDVIYSAVDHRRNISNFLAVRTALIGITLVVFAVITWQSMTVKDFSSKQMLPNTTGILVPTPSTHTATSTIQSDCKETKYIVQPGDTLDGIALTFSIARESILLANHLMDETLAPSRELILPICKSTPTGTTHPPSRLRRCSR